MPHNVFLFFNGNCSTTAIKMTLTFTLPLQGKQSLVTHFQNSSLLHEDKRCRPILFESNGDIAGEQEPFPVSGEHTHPHSAHSFAGSCMIYLQSACGLSASLPASSRLEKVQQA